MILERDYPEKEIPKENKPEDKDNSWGDHNQMKIPKFEAQTEWVKPTEFPDLRQVDEIAIDLETKDPDLIKKGSGSVIGNGDVIGIAVATKTLQRILSYRS